MEKLFETKNLAQRHKTNYLANRVLEIRKCERCGRDSGHPVVHMTLDHIIPVQILQWMGYDMDRYWDDENIEIICRACNSIKGNKLDFSNPKTKTLLLKYLSAI